NKDIVFVNPAFSTITGYSMAEVIGKNPRLLHSGLMNESFYQEMWRSINETGRWQGELIDARRNGEKFVEWMSLNVLKDEQGKASHYIAVFSDISERKSVEERLAYMAQHDFLTDLPNRVLLMDRLAQAIVYAEREHHKVAIMFLDLDSFKGINDTLGHQIGDKLLQSVASRIRSAARASDTVSRQGGDEFVIMLPDIEDADAVSLIAAKLLEAISQPYLIDGNEIDITTSIGISVFPEDGRDSDVLIKYADAAMYHAKANGRNNYQFFTDEMNRRALDRMAIDKKLRHALERNEFYLHYQPQVDLRTGRIIGVEALLRWDHPEVGLIPPDKFIHIAEENGLIIPIGEWVLREACRQNSAWRSLGLPDIVMVVNLSAVQFRQPNLGEIIMDSLRTSGLDSSGLELEITEGAVMQDAEAVVLLLHKLKDLGIKLAVDDFGTGYSSLSYLKRFPIDKLKIDQSFVRDITIDQNDAAIVTTIISMARNLNLKAIAEGVETADQLAFLVQQECDEMQGHYFSQPMSANNFAELLASGRQAEQTSTQDGGQAWMGSGQWSYSNSG
ncbi:MAG: EAL domain-containing protein, partial [Gallionellaceae bacterium]|nr:EAL domain-containing protein [Gallionellaceae bacterium]